MNLAKQLNSQEVRMSHISRRDLLLLLLASPSADKNIGLGGITRIQKLVFLLEKEQKLAPTSEGFEFTPYKAGPYSPRIYDDLEFLENLGFISKSVSAETTPEEAAEVNFTFESLMGPEGVMEPD